MYKEDRNMEKNFITIFAKNVPCHDIFIHGDRLVNVEEDIMGGPNDDDKIGGLAQYEKKC